LQFVGLVIVVLASWMMVGQRYNGLLGGHKNRPQCVHTGAPLRERSTYMRSEN
jgi:hypothetical protein